MSTNQGRAGISISSRLLRLEWPASTGANLAISTVIGFLYALFLVGPATLNPKNISWLVGDPATYYIGWTALRREPLLHWPLTFTTYVGYPHGTSIAFFDLDPLVAVLLRLFSPLLPSTFQWFGAQTIVVCALQFFFSSLLFKYFFKRNFWAIFLSSLFLLIAPVFSVRLWAHHALGSHWVLLAAFYLFLKLQDIQSNVPPSLVLSFALLQGVAIGTNPYMGIMAAIILDTAVLFAWWNGKLRWSHGLLMIGSMWASFALFMTALGLARESDGYAGSGYRLWPFNLLAPLNPGDFPSPFLPSIAIGDLARYETFFYLGIGTLLLCVALLPSFFRYATNDRRTRNRVLACAGWCCLIALFAASTRITAGPFVVLDLDPQQHLTKYLSIFRGSGRFFWIPYYVILVSVLIGAFRVWKPKTATIIVAVALVLQFIEQGSVRQFLREKVSRKQEMPFHSPVWSQLGKTHRNLMVEPPWQCGPEQSPAKTWLGFGPLGFLALDNNVRTNSYYSARYSNSELAQDCHEGIAQLLKTPLSADSVYLVTPAVAQVIAAGPTGAKACHPIDGFILCAADTDFGLGPIRLPEAPALLPNGSLPPWTDPQTSSFFLIGWNSVEPWGIWSAGDAMLQFQVTPGQRKMFHAVKLQMVLPIGAEPIKYEIRSGDHAVLGTFPGAATPRVERIIQQLPITSSFDGVQRIVFRTKDAVQPSTIGLNADPRTLGLGLTNLTLEP